MIAPRWNVDADSMICDGMCWYYHVCIHNRSIVSDEPGVMQSPERKRARAKLVRYSMSGLVQEAPGDSDEERWERYYLL